MVFDQSLKNEEPIEVHFTKGHSVEMFDLDTLAMQKNATKGKNLID